MKYLLSLIFIIIFNFSAFAQIDTSAWGGKTVLVVINQYANFDEAKQSFRDNWYLTDSVEFLLDTLVKRDLDTFREDTIIIKWEYLWQKSWYVGGYDCYTEDCMTWIFIESIEFKNFQSNQWEKYRNIIPSTPPSINSIRKFQQLISLEKPDFDYKNKSIIVQNYKWDGNFTQLINKRFKDFKIVKYRIGNEEYINIDSEQSIYLYRHQYPLSDYIEIIDLKNNRVIEKIELEPK